MRVDAIFIDDLDDERLGPYRSLKLSNYTKDTGLFIAEGEKLVQRLLDSPLRIHSILVESHYFDRIQGIVPAETPIYVVADRIVHELVGFHFHRGVLACGYRPESRKERRDRPADHIADWAGRFSTLSICPDVTDPENLGAIIRISSAFGVDGVVVGEGAADAYSRRVLRVSMGTAFRVPIYECRSISRELETLRQSGFELAATVLDNQAEPLSCSRRGKKIGILFGNEGHGLPEKILDLCTRRVTIPMSPGTDSLNVAIAAGIVLHHYMRVVSPD